MHPRIEEVYEKYGEWIEHDPNPDFFIATMLAVQIDKMEQEINYLKKRLENAETRHPTRNA